jgi:hypothetical protein
MFCQTSPQVETILGRSSRRLLTHQEHISSGAGEFAERRSLRRVLANTIGGPHHPSKLYKLLDLGGNLRESYAEASASSSLLELAYSSRSRGYTSLVARRKEVHAFGPTSGDVYSFSRKTILPCTESHCLGAYCIIRQIFGVYRRGSFA